MSEASPIAGPGTGRARRLGLMAECAALFAGVPVAMWALFGLYNPLAVLAALTALAAVLLARTPGFRWRELLARPGPGWGWILAGYTAITVALLGLTAWLTVPELFAFPRQRPGLWLMVMVLYPFLSAIPQELIFRPLFFRRYGALFPSASAAILANAAAFSLAHLFYRNPVALAVTLIGGLMMGWAYRRTGSFILVSAMHIVAGQLIFTLGLGIYFYHGAIPAP